MPIILSNHASDDYPHGIAWDTNWLPVVKKKAHCINRGVGTWCSEKTKGEWDSGMRVDSLVTSGEGHLQGISQHLTQLPTNNLAKSLFPIGSRTLLKYPAHDPTTMMMGGAVIVVNLDIQARQAVVYCCSLHALISLLRRCITIRPIIQTLDLGMRENNGKISDTLFFCIGRPVGVPIEFPRRYRRLIILRKQP